MRSALCVGKTSRLELLMVRTRAGVMNPHTTRRPTSSAGYPRALRDVKRVFGQVYENAHVPCLVLFANLGRVPIFNKRSHSRTRARARTPARHAFLSLGPGRSRTGTGTGTRTEEYRDTP